MVRRDFYRAASRHLSACSFLLSILKNINSKDERKTILLEVYYLSGYVIETLISYAIFKFVGCKENDKIEEHRIYTPAFKKHRFSEKLAFAANHKLRFKGIVLIDSMPNDKDIRNLYNNWDSTIRYILPEGVNKSITESAIIKYIEHIKELKKQITNKFI